jgi:molecular chaperone GrpE (heat shock protein)
VNQLAETHYQIIKKRLERLKKKNTNYKNKKNRKINTKHKNRKKKIIKVRKRFNIIANMARSYRVTHKRKVKRRNISKTYE